MVFHLFGTANKQYFASSVTTKMTIKLRNRNGFCCANVGREITKNWMRIHFAIALNIATTRKIKNLSPKKYFVSSCFRFNFHIDLKDRKDTWKGYERKDKDIKEKIKKRNIKLKDKVYFIAFHNDNRLQNVFLDKSVFPFFYLLYLCYHKYLFWTVGRNEKLNLKIKNYCLSP